MKVGAVTGSSHFVGTRNRLKSVNLKPIAQIAGVGSSGQSSGSNPSTGNPPSNSDSQANPSGPSPSLGPSNRAAVIGGQAKPSTGNGSEQSGGGRSTADAAESGSGNQTPSGPGELTAKERRKVQKLRRIDAKVRAHEQAHLAAAGQYAQGGASFEYVTGPDGKQYAVGGEVSMDTSSAGSPKETIQKMRQVKRAATAPANPSSQDQQVAAQAAQKLAEARRKLNQQQFQENGSAGPAEPGSESSGETAPSGESQNNQSDNTSGNGESIERPGDIGVSVSPAIESYIQNQQNTPGRTDNTVQSNNNSGDLSRAASQTSGGGSSVSSVFLSNTAPNSPLSGGGQSLNVLA
jgi:hypothetical protein